MLCLVPSIIKKLKIHLQAAQKKCIGFCLKLNGRYSIKCRDFQKVNWLPIHQRVSQCSLCNIYTFFTKNCPKYFDEIYNPLQTNEVHTRSSYQKLNVPHRKAIYLFVYLFICFSFCKDFAFERTCKGLFPYHQALLFTFKIYNIIMHF